MRRAALAMLAKNISPPNLSIMQDEGFTPNRIKTEVLSGLTVALALVPEAVAFAFVAGVHPLVGFAVRYIRVERLIGRSHAPLLNPARCFDRGRAVNR